MTKGFCFAKIKTVCWKFLSATAERYRVLRTVTKRRAFRNIREKDGKRETVESYLGLLSHGNTYHLAKRVKGLGVDF